MASRRATFLFASCLALERSDLQLLALSSTLALSGLGVKFILGPALVDAAPPPAGGYDAELAAHVRRCASERRETASCGLWRRVFVHHVWILAAALGFLDIVFVAGRQLSRDNVLRRPVFLVCNTRNDD